MSAESVHLATLAHEGRFWDVYVEFQDPEPHDRYVRARLRFSAADESDDGATARDVYTAPIFVEDSHDEILARARSFHSEQVIGLLRSCLP
ncbi:MAG TPA: hypothetical protein VNZ57_16080 [Longimicrobiales bacterium]|nr:hypothetical protein [Longimicrobiales bacterium]